MDETLQELERQFCPPIETSALYAIASDFDLANKTQLDALRQLLEPIRASAEFEEQTGFDPSGSSNTKYDSAPDDIELSPSEGAHSTETSVTDVTSAFSAFTFDENGYDAGIDSLSKDDKVALLKEMFAGIRPFDVEFTLQKQKGNFGAACEALLTQTFLAETTDDAGLAYEAPKGVEGFAAESGSRPGKKGKSKRRKNLSKLDLDTKLVDGPASTVNRWQMARDDVEFLAERVNLDEKTVRSIYNAAGHSRRATIISICKKDPKRDLGCETDSDDALVQSSIVDLCAEFPSVNVAYATNLTLLTHPLMKHARELAEVISDSYQEAIVPQYASSKIDIHGGLGQELDDDSTAADVSSLPVNGHFDVLRSSAFAQASAAYRKSRSNPLMGGAAAYYAELGHNANAALKRARAVEANNRVAAQSSREMCDLHGVTVADANRIAKQYVERWWEQRREWSREGSTMGGSVFRLVVGRGSHSSAGVSKLGPAVAKMLKNEGWKVDEQVGELVVRGRARK